VLRIFGPEFVEGEAALRILIVGMIMPVMVGTVGFILIMAGRTGWDLLVYVGGFTVDVGLALALARPDALGVRGAAIAQAVTLTLSAIARLLLVRRFLGIWPFEGLYLRLLAPTVIGGVAMAGAHAIMPDAGWLLDLMVSAGLGTVAYGAALIAFGLKPSERATALRLAGTFSGRGHRTG
jgi:O-antigen/teichoic acid export membrane protein